MSVPAVTSALGRVFGMLTLCLGSEVSDQRSCSPPQTLCHIILRTCGGRNSSCLSYCVLSLCFAAARFKVPNPAVLAWTISIPTNETITNGFFQLDSSSVMGSPGHLCWHLWSPITCISSSGNQVSLEPLLFFSSAACSSFWAVSKECCQLRTLWCYSECWSWVQ